MQLIHRRNSVIINLKNGTFCFMAAVCFETHFPKCSGPTSGHNMVLSLVIWYCECSHGSQKCDSVLSPRVLMHGSQWSSCALWLRSVPAWKCGTWRVGTCENASSLGAMLGILTCVVRGVKVKLPLCLTKYHTMNCPWRRMGEWKYCSAHYYRWN